MKTILGFFLLSNCISSFAASPENTTSHQKSAEELLSIINPRETIITAVMATTEPMIAQCPESKRSSVREAFMRFASSIADSPDLSNKMTAIYKETFSEYELNELVKFYTTPVGEKSLLKMPELFQKGAIIGQQIAQEKEAALQSDLNSILKQ